MKTGLVHIYTGNGKGKTTSSVGLAVRALSHNLKVCYSYFHKNPEEYGNTEIQNLKKLGATVYGFAKVHPLMDKNVSYASLKEECKNALLFLEQLVKNEQFDLLIIDEAIISVRDGFLTEEVLLEFIEKKPKKLELVLTGRGAGKNLIEKADYVSEIVKIKHPFDEKIVSREGIEY